MWFCFNDGFVSVVQSDQNSEILMVRGRSYQHLKNVFDGYNDPLTGKPFKIHSSPTNDYGFRVFCSKNTWNRIVFNRIRQINYFNFKNSVTEKRLHRLYEEFWFLHMVYQDGKNWWKKRRRAWVEHISKPASVSEQVGKSS